MPGRPVGHWPGHRTGPRGAVLAVLLAVPILVAIQGCGGATAPCPTPTTELDQLRSKAERLEQEMDQVTRKEDEGGEEREAAQRRVAEAQAAIDSIVDARRH
jgi:outer membrane murein-binding lipoprotein Lpp